MISWVILALFLGVIYSGLHEGLLFKYLSKANSHSSDYKKRKDKLETTFVLIGLGVLLLLSSGVSLLLAIININYITVVFYTILLSLVFSKNLYVEYNETPQNFKDAFHNGITKTASTCWWFFLPGKVLIYICSLILLIISQLVDLQIITPNAFCGEFFKLHEYAILIIISVDAITEHVIPDLKRILVLANARDKEEKQ